MRSRGEEPLWDGRLPTRAKAAFLCEMLGASPGHPPPGPRTNPRSRSEMTVPPLRAGVVPVAAGPARMRGVRLRELPCGRGASGPWWCGAVCSPVAHRDSGVVDIPRDLPPGLFFEAGVPSGQSGQVLDFAVGRSAVTSPGALHPGGGGARSC